jgi:hypothetical protein
VVLACEKPTGPERAVLDAIEAGALVELPLGARTTVDLAKGETWGEERQVRAQLLYELLTGRTGKDVRPRALKLASARITGTLDLEGAELVCPVLLTGCWFEQPVNLAEASVPALRLPGCHVPALHAEQLTVRGNLELNEGFTARGEVRLLGAHIGGRLSFNGARLANHDGPALNGDRLAVDQSMFCFGGFRAIGEVRLGGAHIAGRLSFSGATLTNPDGSALFADGLSVDRDMFCSEGFTARGEVSLLGAHIGGNLLFDGARLANPGGYALSAARLTVDQDVLCGAGLSIEGTVRLAGARISGNLNLNGADLTGTRGLALDADGLTVDQDLLCGEGFSARGELHLHGAHIGGGLGFVKATLANPDGRMLFLQDLRATTLLLRDLAPPPERLDLTRAQVGALVDDPDSWPPEICLREFTYDALSEGTPVSAHKRLQWLRRDPEGYAPQPYEQLVAVYRRAGRDQDARSVAIAKQRARRRTLAPHGRMWSLLLDALIGYGYRTWLAGLWLLGFLVVGWVVFAWAYPTHMAPTKRPGEALPQFQPFVYALDTLLPVVDLQQQNNWIPRGVAQWWAWVSILSGWVLTTAVVAALTGLVRKD